MARRPPRADLFSLRSQILLGAATAFGARGHAAASVEHILEAAKVSRRTFYRFFRSKEDVFEQLFETAAIMFVQAIRAAAASGGDPEATLSRCLDAYLELPRTAGPLFHVFHREANSPGSPLFARRERVIDELVAMLDQGYQAMHRRAADPLVLRGVIAALERISTYALSQPSPAPAEIAHAKAAMLHIVRSTLMPPMPAAKRTRPR